MRNFITKTVKGNEAQLSGKALAARLVLLVLVLGVILTGIVSLVNKKTTSFDSGAATTFTVNFCRNNRALTPHYANFDNEYDKNANGNADTKNTMTYERDSKLSNHLSSSFLTVGQENPANPGHYFKGWYSLRLGAIVDFENQLVNYDLMNSWTGKTADLVAMWDFQPDYSVTVDYGLGEEPDVYELKHNVSTVAIAEGIDDFVVTEGLAENELSKEYVFEGWYSESDYNEASKIASVNHHVNLQIPKCAGEQHYGYKYNAATKEVQVFNNTETTPLITLSTDVKLFAKWDVVTTYDEDYYVEGENGNNGGNGGTDNNGGIDNNKGTDNSKKPPVTSSDDKTVAGSDAVADSNAATDNAKKEVTVVTKEKVKEVPVVDNDNDGVPNYRDGKDNSNNSNSAAYKTHANKSENVNLLALMFASALALMIIGMIIYFVAKKDDSVKEAA